MLAKMKLLTLVALISFTSARVVDWADILEENTAYGYMSKIGAPLAKKIRKLEEDLAMGRIVGGSPSRLGEHPHQVLLFHFHFLLQNIAIMNEISCYLILILGRPFGSIYFWTKCLRWFST